MNKLVHIIMTSLIIFGAQTSSAVVLNFDDIPGFTEDELGQNRLGMMPTYKGFSFSSPPFYTPASTLYWIDVVDLIDPDYKWNYGAVSGDFALSNQEANTGFIIEASNTDFTFDGIWVKQWGTAPDSGGDGMTGTMSGYNDGDLIWLVETSINGSYKNFGPQEGPIDELRLDFGNYFLADNIVLNAVPVPAAAWLFGSGLIGLVGVARRKSQA